MSEDKTLKDIIEKLEKLTIKETVTLIDTLEEQWGVSAAAAPAASSAASAVAAEEDDDEKEVKLTAMGDKIKTIKAVREINSALSLMDAKKAVEAITESTPYSLGKFNKEKAKELVQKFKDLNTNPVLS